jgi:hypothetical protein
MSSELGIIENCLSVVPVVDAKGQTFRLLLTNNISTKFSEFSRCCLLTIDLHLFRNSILSLILTEH